MGSKGYHLLYFLFFIFIFKNVFWNMLSEHGRTWKKHKKFKMEMITSDNEKKLSDIDYSWHRVWDMLYFIVQNFIYLAWRQYLWGRRSNDSVFLMECLVTKIYSLYVSGKIHWV